MAGTSYHVVSRPDGKGSVCHMESLAEITRHRNEMKGDAS